MKIKPNSERCYIDGVISSQHNNGGCSVQTTIGFKEGMEVITHTCLSCGERWYTPIDDREAK